MKKKAIVIKKKLDFGTDDKIHDRVFAKLMKNPKAQETYAVEEAMFNFVEAIKKDMAEKHLSYYAVAKKANIDHQVLARILNGQKNAEVTTLTKVAYGAGGKLDLVYSSDK
jgi:DNA-binding phage protein